MTKDTSGCEAFGAREPADPLAPVTRGLAFISDHQRLAFTGENAVDPEALATLRRLLGQVAIIDDLPERTEVNPDLRASIASYPHLQSQIPLPTPDQVIDLIHSSGSSSDDVNQA